MIRLPPRSTRTDTLFPYTTLFRSRIKGRLMGINAADFTTMGASSARVQVKKYNHIRDLCIANGHPLINLMECAGGRIPDIMGAAGQGGGGESGRYCRERVVPTASAALGLTYGRGAFVEIGRAHV